MFDGVFREVAAQFTDVVELLLPRFIDMAVQTPTRQTAPEIWAELDHLFLQSVTAATLLVIGWGIVMTGLTLVDVIDEFPRHTAIRAGGVLALNIAALTQHGTIYTGINQVATALNTANVLTPHLTTPTTHPFAILIVTTILPLYFLLGVLGALRSVFLLTATPLLPILTTVAVLDLPGLRTPALAVARWVRVAAVAVIPFTAVLYVGAQAFQMLAVTGWHASLLANAVVLGAGGVALGSVKLLHHALQSFDPPVQRTPGQ